MRKYRYTITTKQWKCPNCQTVIKKERSSDLDLLVCLMALPITLIVLLINFLVKLLFEDFTKSSKPHTKSGKKVIICKNCGKYLITSESHSTTFTRVAYSKQDILNIIEPVLRIVSENNIAYEIIETTENIVEDIKIKYINKNNGKSVITEIYVYDDGVGFDKNFLLLMIVCDGKRFNYSHKNYAYLIFNKLEYSLPL